MVYFPHLIVNINIEEPTVHEIAMFYYNKYGNIPLITTFQVDELMVSHRNMQRERDYFKWKYEKLKAEKEQV